MGASAPGPACASSISAILTLPSSVTTPLDDQTVFFRMKNSELLHFYRGCPLTVYVLAEDDPHKMVREEDSK